MDVVYMVRDDDRNHELRYSLRSLANLKHDRVWIVGHRPLWVSDSVGWIPTRQGHEKHENTWRAWWEMATAAEVSTEFTLMNDDFFIMRPTERVPTLHVGPLVNWVEELGRGVGSRRRVGHTLRLLQDVDRAQSPLLSYELHVPMVMDRAELMRAMVLGQAYRNRTLCAPLGKRSLYGNLACIGGERGLDPKVRNNTDVPDASVPVVSTQDSSFNYGRVGSWLRARFPEASPYEAMRPAMPRARVA